MRRPVARLPDILTREIIALGVYVDDPVAVARCYGRALGMTPVGAAGPGGDAAPTIIFMAGADAAPWIVLVARRTASGELTDPPGVPPGPGLRRLVCLTDDLRRDARWLEERGLGRECRLEVDGVGQVRWRSVALENLGYVVDLVEAPGEVDNRSKQAIARSIHAFGVADAGDVASEAARVALCAVCAPETSVAALRGAPLDHMAGTVLDSDLAVELARELLGCHLVDELTIPHESGPGRVRLARQNPPDGFLLALGHTNAGESHPFRRQIAERGGPGIHHVAHRVAGLEIAIDEARSGGAIVMGTMQEADGLLQVFVSAAEDGLVHELVQRVGVAGFIKRNTAGLLQVEDEWGTRDQS